MKFVVRVVWDGKDRIHHGVTAEKLEETLPRFTPEEKATMVLIPQQKGATARMRKMFPNAEVYPKKDEEV